MKRFFILPVLLSVLLSGCLKSNFIDTVIVEKVGELVSFTPVGDEDLYLTVKRDELIAYKTRFKLTNSERMAATFKLVKGLNGDREAVSFASYTSPEHYLRVKEGALILQAEFTADRDFYDDASFLLSKGQSRQKKDLALRPYKQKNAYVLIKDQKLIIMDKENNRDFDNNSSFVLRKPLYKEK